MRLKWRKTGGQTPTRSRLESGDAREDRAERATRARHTGGTAPELLTDRPANATSRAAHVWLPGVVRSARARVVDRLGPEWTRAWMWAIGLWAASRLSIVVATYFGVLLASPDAVTTPDALMAAWKRWDANWYVEIAAHGYAQPQAPAFFPLYPLLIRGLHILLPGLSLFGCALVLSNVALLVAVALLIRLLEREFGQQVAYGAALLLLAYPAAFFLSTAYAESVFLVFVFGAFGALRTGRWPLAGVLAALATLTRPTGLMLSIPFIWEYLRQSPISLQELKAEGWRVLSWSLHKPALQLLAARLAALCGMPLAVGLYSGYLWWRFGQPLLYKRVEGAYWNHQHASPVAGLVMGVEALGSSPLSTFGAARGLLDVVPIVCFIVVLLLGARIVPVAYTLFGIAIATLSLSAPIPGSWPLQSGIRYLMPAFPVFVSLSIWGRRWPQLRSALLYLWLPLQGILLVLFVHGQWII